MYPAYCVTRLLHACDSRHCRVILRRGGEVSINIALPADYRREEVFNYFARDPQQLSERVDAEGLRKAILLGGAPAVVSVRLCPGQAQVTVSGSDDAPHALRSLVHHWLGLNQDVAGFESRFAGHPVLGLLIRRRPGLRIAQGASPFETLCWAVIGQLISVKAAVSIRARLIQLAGVPTPFGMLCHPGTAEVAALDEPTLRGVGLTRGKALALQSISRRILGGEVKLDLAEGCEQPDILRERLLAQKGIGPWTAEYVLLRGFASADCSLHGDVAVRRSLQQQLGLAQRPTANEAQAWLSEFAPYRSMVAAHLWSALGDLQA